jgi:aspartyl-tRNA(Asn)/glutamyl-tRNA(Gln) amidotransferase subunit C
MDEKQRPMADGFERTEVERLAQLARLRLSEDEITRFAGQLARILAYAETVREADTSDVLPTSHPLPEITGRLREDAPSPSLSRDDAIAAAPDADPAAGLFSVPRVL